MSYFNPSKERLISIIREKGACVHSFDDTDCITRNYCDSCSIYRDLVHYNYKEFLLFKYQKALDIFISLYGEEGLFEALL